MPRDSSGNYTLPAGNPVATGTPIQSDWANDTMGDLGNEMTNSLSRDGQGGMNAPLQFVDGDQFTPGISFVLEPSLGWYRKTTSVIGFAANSEEHMSYSAPNDTYALIHGISPTFTLFPAGPTGLPTVNFRDSAGGVRGELILDEASGGFSLTRKDAGGVTETKLDLTDDGNVSVNGAAPTVDADLTRKDYVDAGDLANSAEAAAAQSTADDAEADALAAQSTADQAITDAANADANANTRVLKSGDTMTGQLNGITPTAAANMVRKDYSDLNKLDQDFLLTGTRLDIFNVRTS